LKGDDWANMVFFWVLRNRNSIKRCLTIYVQTVRDLSNFVPIFIAAEKTIDAALWGPMMLSGDAARGKEVKRERKRLKLLGEIYRQIIY
jgi:hypothetical protein